MLKPRPDGRGDTLYFVCVSGGGGGWGGEAYTLFCLFAMKIAV